MAKSKPIGVRFDLEKLDMIQKEQNLTSVQQVVNYLMDNYEKTLTPELKHADGTYGTWGTSGNGQVKRGAPFKNMPPYGIGTSNLGDMIANGTVTAKNTITPPKGLKGIDLIIWKSENGI